MRARFSCWLFLSMFLLLFLEGCKDKETEKVLTLATSADNPPFEFYQTTKAHSQISGFEIELAQEIEKVLGIAVKIHDMDFTSIIPAILSGRADFAMATIAITQERQKNVSFSEAYYTAQAAAVTLKDHALMQPQDFTDKKIGVQLGSTHEQMMKKMASSIKDLHLIPLNKIGDLIQEVKAGRIDAAVIDLFPARFYVENNEDLQVNLIEGYQESYAIAFPKDSIWRDKFNDALKHLKANGKLAELTHKWFNVS